MVPLDLQKLANGFHRRPPIREKFNTPRLIVKTDCGFFELPLAQAFGEQLKFLLGDEREPGASM